MKGRLFRNAFKSSDFEANDDDILEFLSNYKCYRVHSKNNIHSIIRELAHQELVQKPKYIANCWYPILTHLTKMPDFQNVKSLLQFYDSKKSTAKKVLKLLIAEASTDAERQSFEHLKRYIRSLDKNMLPVFLQFVTGSDIVGSNIPVSFTDLVGTMRRPVAHTCGPQLELPSTYGSYNELAEEFSNILQNKEAWYFDIL